MKGGKEEGRKEGREERWEEGRKKPKMAPWRRRQKAAGARTPCLLTDPLKAPKTLAVGLASHPPLSEKEMEASSLVK